jgi:hypothetical protein
VEAQVEALLAIVHEDVPFNFRPCDVSKKIQSLKLGKTRGFEGIPNKYLRHLPRRPLVHLTHLFNHCLRLGHFPASWKEAKIITLLEPGKYPKFHPNVRQISLLSSAGKLYEKLILRTIQKYTEERSSQNARQFGFRTNHSMALQCMRLTEHVTLNFNNNMSRAVVFLDIEKAFGTTRNSGLLYKLSEVAFSTNLITLIASFLTNRKLKVLVEGKFSTPRERAPGAPQGSVLAPVVHSIHINDDPAATGTNLGLFTGCNCIYAPEKRNVVFSANCNAASL